MPIYENENVFTGQKKGSDQPSAVNWVNLINQCGHIEEGTWAEREHTLSRAAYLAMRKLIVAAAVLAAETMTIPGTVPKTTPAVIVSGTAGTAKISSPV